MFSSQTTVPATTDWHQLAQQYLKFNPRLREGGSSYLPESLPSGYPRIPPNLVLRPYQRLAVANWLEHRGRGTLKMTTGAGKTITALAIATELYQKIGLQVLLVLCPFRHLVSQWCQECQKFNLQPILAFENVHQWQRELSSQLYSLQSGNQSFLSIITTNSTFISEGFQSQIAFLPDRTLIVGDEAHNLGSPATTQRLPKQIGLRLALSATPTRYFDEDGTEAVFNYFGEVIPPEFTLKDGIEQKALVPYLYYPILVELTESEAAIYAKLTKRIGWALQKNTDWNSETLTSLLMKRSRLTGAAENKLQALKTLMQQRLNTSHTLFYCGDGYLEHHHHPSDRRQLQAVTRILGKELGYRVNTYTAETPLEQRLQLQQQFERGDLQGLVAIRCLDEGVDIPSVQTAVILASTGNPRQFIQRRGRMLRPHPHKTKATLFDMIVVPPQLDREALEIEKNLLRRELKRFLEFAEIAENASEARQILLNLQEQYYLDNSKSYDQP